MNYTQDPIEVLEHQKDLQVLYTGGTVIHFFLQESPEEHTVAKFVKFVFENYPVPYITITPTFSVCEDHGYIGGGTLHLPRVRKRDGDLLQNCELLQAGAKVE